MSFEYDTADQNERSEERRQVGRSHQLAVKDDQAGRTAASNTCRDKKWHRMFPDTVSANGEAITPSSSSMSTGLVGDCGTVFRW